MATLQIDVLELPQAPLDAAADFYLRELPEIRDDSDILPDHDLVIVFEPASHEHRAWRLAAVQELAREMAPRRVNALASADGAATAAGLTYLAGAAGLTGQYLPLDNVGAGFVVLPPA